MKWYTIFCGEDFSDHSVGYLYENFDSEDYSPAGMLEHAKNQATHKAWLMLVVTSIDAASHEVVISKLFEHWEPMRKKIVLDPKKGKGKKTKKPETLDQAPVPPTPFSIDWSLATAQGTIILEDPSSPPEEF